MLPILYSFRRCPYAMRARYTLIYAGIEWEHREILLRDKPPQLLEISSKGTVPVLQLPDGTVMDESYDIMRWAVAQHDPDHWYPAKLREPIDAWVGRCDREFKPLLDAYKYQEGDTEEAVAWLQNLAAALDGGFLFGQPTLADAALFPFVRQFRNVDPEWCDHVLGAQLVAWLSIQLESDRFLRIMEKRALWIP